MFVIRGITASKCFGSMKVQLDHPGGTVSGEHRITRLKYSVKTYRLSDLEGLKLIYHIMLFSYQYLNVWRIYMNRFSISLD